MKVKIESLVKSQVARSRKISRFIRDVRRYHKVCSVGSKKRFDSLGGLGVLGGSLEVSCFSTEYKKVAVFLVHNLGAIQNFYKEPVSPVG